MILTCYLSNMVMKLTVKDATSSVSKGNHIGKGERHTHAMKKENNS